jgi:hypothetical protein
MQLWGQVAWLTLRWDFHMNPEVQPVCSGKPQCFAFTAFSSLDELVHY